MADSKPTALPKQHSTKGQPKAAPIEVPSPQEFLLIYNKLVSQSYCSRFKSGIDMTELDFVDKYPVNFYPSCLDHIKLNIDNQIYQSFSAFELDLRAIFHSVLQSCKPENEVFCESYQMLTLCDVLFAAQKKKQKRTIKEKIEKIDKGMKKVEKVVQTAAENRRETPLTFTEKSQLSDLIRNKLSPEFLWDVCKIVTPENNEADELVFDMEELSTPVLRKLQEFVFSKVNLKKRTYLKANLTETVPNEKKENESTDSFLSNITSSASD